MEQAIKKAIEGGYNKIYMELDFSHPKWKWQIKAIPLDPTFWQCLGKAEEWKDQVCEYGHESTVDYNHQFCETCDKYSWDLEFTRGWKYHWHRFIDHLADNKSPNDFFTELLSLNNKLQ